MTNMSTPVGQTALHRQTGSLLRDLREQGVSYLITYRWGRAFAELRPLEETAEPVTEVMTSA